MRGINRNPLEGVMEEAAIRASNSILGTSAGQGSETPGLPARIVTIQDTDGDGNIISKHIALTNIDSTDDEQAVTI